MMPAYSLREPTMQIEPLPFAKLMGITVVSVTPDLVIGELKVREDLCTRPAVLHGGAYMAFADTIGAVATLANLKDGESTTTIESKTNFFAAIPLGGVAHAERQHGEQHNPPDYEIDRECGGEGHGLRLLPPRQVEVDERVLPSNRKTRTSS